MASDPHRIRGLDMARALAVMGMVVVNFASMMGVRTYGVQWIGTVVEFIYGRAATLFVVLAGVSISLMAKGRSADERGRHLRPYLLKRCLLLLLAGTLLSFWWEADILHFYALFIALGVWFSAFSSAALRKLTAASMVISVPVCAALTVAYDLDDTLALARDLPWAALPVLDFLGSRYYSLLPWMAFFLIGMLLGRRGAFDPSFCRRCLICGMLLCAAVELFSSAMMGWVGQREFDIEGNWWIAFLRSEAFPVTPLFMISSLATALAVIGLSGLAADRPGPATVPAPLLAFGRLSLTLYVAHLFWGFGVMRLLHKSQGAVTGSQLLLTAAVFCLAGMWASTGWLRLFKRGPVEAVFHRLAGSPRPRPRRLQPLDTDPGGLDHV